MLVKTELKGENPQVTKMQYEAHVMPPPTPPESYCASDEKLLDDQEQEAELELRLRLGLRMEKSHVGQHQHIEAYDLTNSSRPPAAQEQREPQEQEHLQAASWYRPTSNSNSTSTWSTIPGHPATTPATVPAEERPPVSATRAACKDRIWVRKSMVQSRMHLIRCQLSQPGLSTVDECSAK